MAGFADFYKPIGVGRKNLGGGFLSRVDEALATPLPMEGRATILPARKTKQGTEFAVPGLLAAPWNSFVNTGRVLSGEAEYLTDEAAMEDALNLAGMVGLGGIATTAVKPAPAGSLGMFVGARSKTWNAPAAAKAKEMTAAGVDPKTIWQETGTFMGKDGKWRQEIPDVGAQFPFMRGGETVTGGLSKGGRFAHKELVDAYPDTRQMTISAKGTFSPESSGWYRALGDEIEISAPTSGGKSSFLHELQHGVQAREGFARGGSPETNFGVGLTKETTMDAARDAYNRTFHSGITGDPLLDELVAGAKKWEDLPRREQLGWIDQGRHDRYQRLHGEAEARLVQARMNMTPEQLKAQYPLDPEYFRGATGVSLEDLIVRGGDGGPMMSVAPKIKASDVTTSEFGRIPKTGDAVYSMADMLESAGNKAGYIVTRDSSGASSSQYLTFTKPGDDAGEFTRQIRLATHADKYPEQASGIRMSVDPSTENTFEQAARWLAKEGYPTKLSAKYKDIKTFDEYHVAQRALHDSPEAKLERATSAWRNKPKATRGPQPTIEQFSDQPTLASVPASPLSTLHGVTRPIF